MTSWTRCERRVRRVTGGALAIISGLLVVAPVWARPVARCGNVDRAGAWTSIKAPATVGAFALRPGGPGRIVVSDGQSVYGSLDGGCSWRLLLTLPAVPSQSFPFTAERVVAIAAPSPSAIYLAVSGPHVVVSRDGGGTWTTSDSGIAGRGDPLEIVAAPGDPDRLYLPVRLELRDDALDFFAGSTGSSATVTSTFSSNDGGRTWSLAGRPAAMVEGPRGRGLSEGTIPGTASDLAVASGDPDRLWAATGEGLFTSGDGGASWEIAVEREGIVGGADIRAVDVPDAGPIGVIAVDPATGTVYTSPRSDGTGAWTARKFVGLRTAYSVYSTVRGLWLAHSSAGAILATGPKGVFRLGGTSWSDVSPISLDAWASSLVEVAAEPGANVFYGRPKNVGTWLYRYDARRSESATGLLPNGDRGEDGSLKQLSQHIGPLAPPAPARIAPARASVRLPAGASATMTYELSLPPRPTPLDVFFLLDSTSSMGNAIRSLTRSVAAIVSEVRARGIDVWAGVGEFRTYPYPGEESVNFPYRRDLPVSSPGPRLPRALLGIEGRGESGANLAALVQAATGAGQDVLPPRTSGGDIDPGLDARFRPGAIPVIVHAADERFGTPERGGPGGKFPPPSWPGPGFDEAVAALKGAGVLQVGAAIGFGTEIEPPAGSTNALDDLRVVARGTRTLAVHGIDCDGDGSTDVATGEPLVCPVPGGNGAALAPAIVSLIDGIRDVAPVRLVAASGSEVVDSISPSLYPAVDLKRLNLLAFEVTYHCPVTRSRAAHSVSLEARLRDQLVATALVKVTCVPRRVPPMSPASPEDVPPVGALLPPPLPPPPPPPASTGLASAPAPQPQPQPNPNPNPQAQPQPVPVPQRQQQPQVAFVHAAQDVRQQLEMEYAMTSAHSGPRPLDTVKLGLAAGALSLVLLYGYATVAVRSVRNRSVLR